MLTKRKMSKWEKLASADRIEKAVEALKRNGINAFVADNSDKAIKKVLELIPENSEVMTMTSMTLEETEISSEINNSGKYDSVRNKLYKMDRKKQGKEMNRLGAAPEFVLGSVHAVTENGELMIASASGSQLPAYAYSGGKVIFVAGTQKIVKNFDEGLKRVYDYVFPLEDKRALDAYGVNSGVNKVLIINKEIQQERITVIFVKEKLGF